jgi:hypothetical protein
MTPAYIPADYSVRCMTRPAPCSYLSCVTSMTMFPRNLMKPANIKALPHTLFRPVKLAAGFMSVALSVMPAKATQVRVVETSLGITDNVRLLRHLGLRFGDDNDYLEAHFGPGAGGPGHDGFLKTGKGEVADSKYLEVLPAGARRPYWKINTDASLMTYSTCRTLCSSFTCPSTLHACGEVERCP